MPDEKMWGGRFSTDEDPLFAEFNRSLGFDRQLMEFDIQASLAYAQALERAGVFTAKERRRVEGALGSILEEHQKSPGKIARSRAEDVHTYVEQELAKRVGSLAYKLHTGRSRNDQVATDLRLYLSRRSLGIEQELNLLLRVLLTRAEQHPSLILPGYTHLQRAQPVLFAHYLLAFGEMLLRDRNRLRENIVRMSVCPLGAGALSGTVYRVDRGAIARQLGFASPADNSMDAVSDRDFVLDFLFFASTLMMHLSRLAEDLILFNSAEFGFIHLDDSVSSGSSLMPQKKNPDALELIRGKTGRVYGHLLALLTAMKGLPMTYNKDMQEDKEGLFDAVGTVEIALRMTCRVLERMDLDSERIKAAGAQGYLNATELADYLVEKGVPFREAHRLVGRIVVRAVELGKRLEQLSMADYRSFSCLFAEDLYDRLGLEAVVARRRERGGTAPAAVARALKRFRKKIDG